MPKKKPFDTTQFEKLCMLQCTELEICAWFDMSDETLNKRCKESYDGKTFLEVFALKRSKGKTSLRRNQWKQSENSAAMAIFLGKQYLGQKDEKHMDHTTKGESINQPKIPDKVLAAAYKQHLENQDAKSDD